jgi:NADPH-dependent 2,4-dienoyl-CoA reductase/sulfur reductase-like enzyme/nitrite reductase/ring-hydroxylating ferredoxin subunit
MGGGAGELSGPDFSQGVPAADLAEGKSLLGHAGGEAVLLARVDGDVFAVGATCTHYSGPLAEGIVVGDTVRCPWHHACFSLRSGEAVRAPALNPIPCFHVEKRDDKLFVLGKKPVSQKTTMANAPDSVVIVGGGAAGHAAAEMLRREGYRWPIIMVSADAAPPVDRPNLSKDYLAGTAPEEWIPLRPTEFFAEHDIELVQNARVTAIDTAKKTVSVEGGKSYKYGALLLATGADPVKLSIPGAELPHVHTLRTLADSRAIIEQLGSSKRAVVIGASFIGLEVAAALRTRNLEVHVVAPDALPLEKVLGSELGNFIKHIHEGHGVVFHLGRKPKSIDKSKVTLDDGSELAADLVVTGIGVRPNVELAEAAGLATDRGVTVDAYLTTSAEHVYAAGDIARWPDPHTGDAIRVEHWVVAQRQGQIAARNMLGKREKCELAPFFWSQHYDIGISYVGHAEKWDSIVIEGNIGKKDAKLSYKRGQKTLAVATLGRDLQSLKAEVELERS